MRMRAIAALILALTVSATPVLAGQDGSIDIFPYNVDPANGNTLGVNTGACQAPVTNVGGFFHKIVVGVYARLNGASMGGISGAEFYLTGVEIGLPGGLPGAAPPSNNWSKVNHFPLPTGSTIQAGALSDSHIPPGSVDPARRLNTTWVDVFSPDAPNCQKAGLVELVRLEMVTGFFQTNPTFGNNHYLKVLGPNPAATLGCGTSPMLFLCNNPAFTAVCVTGGQFIINPVGASIEAQCTVAVEQKTWGGMKELYR